MGSKTSKNVRTRKRNKRIEKYFCKISEEIRELDEQ